MPIPPDSPCGRALRYSQMLTDFACSPYPPQPESPAPAWLATPEGQQYMQAMARGDEAEARRIVDEAGARNLYDILGTMFDDQTTQS